MGTGGGGGGVSERGSDAAGVGGPGVGYASGRQHGESASLSTDGGIWVSHCALRFASVLCCYVLYCAL